MISRKFIPIIFVNVDLNFWLWVKSETFKMFVFSQINCPEFSLE